MSSLSDLDQDIIDKMRQKIVNQYRHYLNDVNIDIDSIETKFDLNNDYNTNFQLFSDSHRNDNVLFDEHTNILELLQTCGNTQLNKLLLVLASLIQQMNHLSAYAIKQFIGPIVLYREDHVVNSYINQSIDLSGDNKIVEDDEFSAVAAILPMLFDLICFVKRCYQVVSNLIQQQHTLVSYANIKSKDEKFNQKLRTILPDLGDNLRFDLVWESLSNLIVTIINLDMVFSQQQSAIRHDISNYKRSLESVVRDCQHFQMQHKQNEIQTLLCIINEIDYQLFEAHITNSNNASIELQSINHFLFFKGLINCIINLNIAENEAILKNGHLNENMANHIRNVCAQMVVNENKFVDDYRLLSVTALYSFYVHLFWKDSDRKLMKTIIETQKKLNIVYSHLPGNIDVSSDQLLVMTLPKQLADTRLFDHFVNQRELLMKAGVINHQIKCQIPVIAQWIVAIEQSFKSGFYNDINEIDSLKQMLIHIQLIKQGFDHSRQLSSAIRDCIAIHCQRNRPLTKMDTVALCKAIIVLQGIKRFFATNKKLIIQISLHYQKYNSCAILNVLTRIKHKLLNNVKQYSEKKLDLLSSIILAANCLNGPIITFQRFTLLSLCFSYFLLDSNRQLISSEDSSKIQSLFTRIAFFFNIFTILNQLFDCRFLYFNIEIIKVYFDHFYRSFAAAGNNHNGHNNTNQLQSPFNNADINELQYFFNAIDDSISLFESINDETKCCKLINIFMNDVMRLLQTQLIKPISKDFEDELRFLTHLDLKIGDKNPFKRNLKDFTKLLNAQPIKVFNGRKMIWFKSYIENNLNKLAYNMTTIALHDWKTYESMLGFARNKYGLQFASLQLPTQTLEQGLDVLEITRNIHIFVAAYMYNLNNQFFVERNSCNKHLNVLTIRHIANSIQTHGFGIINSTVNYVYQFLRKKLQTLFQFLFEEHIKCRLLKDVRYFRELMAINSDCTSTAKFPFERADKFMKSMRKLGTTKDGQTYLDKFRQLLTQIGNVMAFVRMLRSGALHCTSQIANFIPDLDELKQTSFEAIIKQEQSQMNQHFSSQTLHAARNLDCVLNKIDHNYSDATDYFRLLVDVFADKFRDSKYLHLANFFIILPATTLNYVEYILLCKDKLNKKSADQSTCTAFTDDGFAMGVIYLLKLFNQFNQFDSLQWFASIDDYVAKTMPSTSTAAMTDSQSGSDNTDQTMNLTKKRMHLFHREFQLLKFNLISSRILFKS